MENTTHHNRLLGSLLYQLAIYASTVSYLPLEMTGVHDPVKTLPSTGSASSETAINALNDNTAHDVTNGRPSWMTVC